MLCCIAWLSWSFARPFSSASRGLRLRAYGCAGNATTTDEGHACGHAGIETRCTHPDRCRCAVLNARIRLIVRRTSKFASLNDLKIPAIGRGDDRVGNPHRAQISQFEFFELVIWLKLGKRLPVERFEATVSQSAVPSPLLQMELIIASYLGILYYTVLYVLYYILYYIHSTISYTVTLYYTILYYTTPYYTVLYHTIIYYTILHYTTLCSALPPLL